MNFLIFLGLSLSLALFQNCRESNWEALSPQAKKGVLQRDSNGTGYSGKLEVVAPRSALEGSRIKVSVRGGAQPYSLTVSNAGIQLITVEQGQYELVIPADQTDYSFTIEALDSEGSRASASIQVLGETDFYDMGSASAIGFYSFGSVGFDSQTRKLTYFETDGSFTQFSLGFAPQTGDEATYGFITQILKVSDNMYMVDQVANCVYIFQSLFSPFRRLDDLDGGLVSPKAVAGNETGLLVVDSHDNSVYQFDLSGDLQGKTVLSGLSSGATLRGIAFTGDGRIAVLDGLNQKLHFYDLSLNYESVVDLSDSVTEGVEYTNLLSVENGRDYYLSRITHTSGNTLEQLISGSVQFQGEQQTLKLSLSDEGNNVLAQLYEKPIDAYHPPSFCLTFDDQKRLVVCNGRNGALAIDEAGEQIKAYNNHDVRNAIPAPGSFVFNSFGELVSISDRFDLRYFDSEFRLKKIISSVPGKPRIDWRDVIRVGGEVLALEQSGLIHVFDEASLSFLRTLELRDEAGELVSPVSFEAFNQSIYVVNSEKGLTRFTLSGEFVENMGQTASFYSGTGANRSLDIVDIGIGSTGKLFLSAPEKAGIFVVESLQDTPVWYNSDTRPASMTVNGEETVYIGEKHDGRILKFTPQDGFSVAFAQAGSRAFFLDPSAIQFEGNTFFVADAVRNSIVLIPFAE